MPGPDKFLSPVWFLIILNFIVFDTGFLGAQDLAKPFINSHFIMVDSVSFHYRIWNDRLEKPRGKVVLIHGFMGSTFSWRENYDTLAKSNYKIIAVDLPGFGYSDRSLKVNQSQSNRARLLWDLLAELDQGDTVKWNIVGHSMGGGTAEAMALLRSERTKSLTIVDGMVFLKNENVQGAFVTASKNRQYNKVVSSLVEKNVLTYNRVESLFKTNYGYTPDSTIVMGYLTPLLIDGSAESILSVFSNSKEIINLDIRELEKLPVLVIWGEEDRTIKLKRGKRFVKNVPSAELKVIPGSRHDPMETNPKEFNGHLIMFLNMNNNK
jgi:2-hydroxy-6-oxonona-2,4-dienedioate hydrolase